MGAKVDGTTAIVNGVKLRYEVHGEGTPLVFIHGSWSSHHTWDLVALRLAESFQVVTYDRRGHSESEKPGDGSVRDDVADAAALIEHLGLAPVWVAGSSFGAAITLRLVGERPDLIQGAIAHEPPLLTLLDEAYRPMIEEADRKIEHVVELIATSDHAGAAEWFVENVAVGPGAWAQFPQALRDTFTENAPTYLDECRDPEQLRFEPRWIEGFTGPVLLTKGDQSPPFFAPIVDELAGALQQGEVKTFEGAGHIPYNTHPDDYVRVVSSFIGKHDRVRR